MRRYQPQLHSLLGNLLREEVLFGLWNPFVRDDKTSKGFNSIFIKMLWQSMLTSNQFLDVTWETCSWMGNFNLNHECRSQQERESPARVAEPLIRPLALTCLDPTCPTFSGNSQHWEPLLGFLGLHPLEAKTKTWPYLSLHLLYTACVLTCIFWPWVHTWRPAFSAKYQSFEEKRWYIGNPFMNHNQDSPYFFVTLLSVLGGILILAWYIIGISISPTSPHPETIHSSTYSLHCNIRLRRGY